jgi:hypothetical protein
LVPRQPRPVRRRRRTDCRWQQIRLIGPALKPSGTGGAITKTGPGTLALPPPQVPVTVAAGTLALAADAVNVAPVPSAPVTVLPGASIEVSGANALSVTPVATDALLLKAPTLAAYPDEWTFLGTAQAGRTDGHLRLTPDLNAGTGCAWLLRKRAVTAPWTARFTYRIFAQTATPADGAAFIIQNDPRGTAALGGGAQNAGYQFNAGVAGITDSVAVGLLGYTNYRWLTLGQGGLWTATNAVLPAFDNTGAPWQVTVRYDGEGTLGVEVERPDRLFRHAQTYAVNLADEIGADEAYVGFAAGTGGAWGAQTITDFTFETDASRAAARDPPAPPRGRLYPRRGRDAVSRASLLRRAVRLRARTADLLGRRRARHLGRVCRFNPRARGPACDHSGRPAPVGPFGIGALAAGRHARPYHRRQQPARRHVADHQPIPRCRLVDRADRLCVR